MQTVYIPDAEELHARIDHGPICFQIPGKADLERANSKAFFALAMHCERKALLKLMQ